MPLTAQLAVKDVLKVPPLDLVGWFTIAPTSGPHEVHLPLHKTFLHYNESAVLLAFHTSLVAEGALSGGKLPLTIYDSVYESAISADGSASRSGGRADSAMMDVDGPSIKFRELPCTVETGEAERIGVEFVARGGGNATAVEGSETQSQPESKASDKGKGRRSEPVQAGSAVDETAYLSPEEEER